MSFFTKKEMAALSKEFFSNYRGQHPKPEWDSFLERKTAEQFHAELDTLVALGYIEPFEDEEGVVRYAPTEKGLASRKKPQLEEIES